MDFDCRACGACCANPDENRAEGVIVEPGDALGRQYRRERGIDR